LSYPGNTSADPEPGWRPENSSRWRGTPRPSTGPEPPAPPATSHPATGGAHGGPAGHNGPVKLRIGTVIAFGVGYTLGSKAGRERYHQIVRAGDSVLRSAPVAGTLGVAGDRARALGTLGVERVRDAVGVRLGWRNGDDAADAIAAGMARDVASALNGQRALANGRRVD